MTWNKVALVILDGFGCAPAGPGNAIHLAATPTLDDLWKRYPHALLDASGMAVGLPPGQQGNSEVGHLTMGAGRVVMQDLTRISAAIEDGGFFENPVLTEAIDRVRSRGATLHLMGLVSPGGVHSHQDHLVAVCELARRRGLNSVLVHVFTDGRDTPTDQGAGFVETLERRLEELGVGRVASVSGRYYAMDRDRRWDRLERAYRTILGRGDRRCDAAVPYLQESYRSGTSDEFIEPAAVVPEGEQPAAIRPGDVVVHCNFRPDRAREICHALVDPEFAGFTREMVFDPADLVTFSNFDETLPVQVAFPKPLVTNTLGDVVANRGLHQFHLAETEKYAHVTYFINGGREDPLDGEGRLLIPSSKVATYDLRPEMSAIGITDALVAHMADGEAALLVANYANADMVGHTGSLNATVRAIECLDQCLDKVCLAASDHGYTLVITADHGNAEQMLAADGRSPLTSHTTNQVPLIARDPNVALRVGGGLRDVAPTLLAGLGMEPPDDMTGSSLLAAN